MLVVMTTGVNGKHITRSSPPLALAPTGVFGSSEKKPCRDTLKSVSSAAFYGDGCSCAPARLLRIAIERSISDCCEIVR